jgi:hypothetical protein
VSPKASSWVWIPKKLKITHIVLGSDRVLGNVRSTEVAPLGPTTVNHLVCGRHITSLLVMVAETTLSTRSSSSAPCGGLFKFPVRSTFNLRAFCIARNSQRPVNGMVGTFVWVAEQFRIPADS